MKQGTLFDGEWDIEPEEWWQSEWQNMPEFVQNNLEPFKSITVHFASEEDMLLFAKLVEQTITEITKSIWFPKAIIGKNKNRRYVDES